ncbi:MAG: 2-amino-4-hydroxy-6-hydroxymethyldihydropteridine diphosphokinase [Steroidobacteraceae bacterium]
MTAVYVAAGSNVEPVANLRRALDVLAAHYPGLRASRAWRNRAVGFEGDDFVNLALGFDTDEDVRSVVGRLHEAEAACGRARDAPKWAPRSMDLDILLYGDLVCDEPGLTLPRPDLLRRAYMLGPLAELAPAVRHPVEGSTMAALWARFDRAAHALEPVELGWPR